MSIRDLLSRIGSSYNRALDFSSEAQIRLRGAADVVSPLIPAGYVVQGSGGRGNTAVVPWIAVFDPDETTSARHGMYVVYLFDAEMNTVALSLNQGVTDVIQRFGTREGRARLALQAATIRNGISGADRADLEWELHLRSKDPLPRHYECGNILARVYNLRSLPADAALEGDLHRFVRLYELALQVRARFRDRGHEGIVSHTAAHHSQLTEFKPKDSSDYRQQISARTLVKSRKHESLVREFGRFLMLHNFEVATNVHPRDLVATRDGVHLLIEAKMVRGGDATIAAREALAQLLMYRKFLYPVPANVTLVAAFSESIGDACAGLLEDFHITSTWPIGRAWANCSDLIVPHCNV